MSRFRYNRQVAVPTSSEEERPAKHFNSPSIRRFRYDPFAKPASPRTPSAPNHIPPKAATSYPSSSSNQTSHILHAHSVKHEPTVPKLEPRLELNAKPKLESDANTLRPSVPASERLSAWKTPFALESDVELLSSLPHNLSSSLKDNLVKALAPSTRGAYGAGIRRFTDFCDEHNISEEARMPASKYLLASFISEQAGSCSASCIKNWMSGLKAWHEINSAPWNGEDRLVQLSRSLAAKNGTSFSRPKRPPITRDQLTALRGRLNIREGKDAAFWALATTAFWGCRRLGELTIPKTDGFDKKLHVQKTAVSFTHGSSARSPSISFDIPWTKTTKEKGGKVVLTARDDDLCPVTALLNHILVNHKVPPDVPLFSYMDNSQSRSIPPVKTKFLEFCNSNVLPHQKKILGHSFRIGGSVELLLAGVPPEVVASIGGWTSSAFLLYWRKLEDIIPLHVSQAYDRQKLAASIDSFRSRINPLPTSARQLPSRSATFS
ncbi:hypothetical protein M378DRAFT_65500 [Amanita muscaria Koide BX008]|uniref:DNA breaking-rejoining enzyme n=1 Tax=Amanita muscaria (strain Koide BX008) TaxID=946122 RepID=A0A0C2XQC7_AMAMK|nr:hypothetical protein M378DRAFT_65500 [Amanita muscaria Koide BX008]